MKTSETAPDKGVQKISLAAIIGALATIIFFFSVKPNQQHFDYTLRIAVALLRGHLGLQGTPPSWLNEMVPWNGEYYSVFPLGAVLSIFPIALLQMIDAVSAFPGRAVAAIIAGLCAYFFVQLSAPAQSWPRRILLGLFPIFGTWMWSNLGFAGAWHIALGFALLGEAGALYFTLVRPRPFWAGAFFALAFGNRTELILVLPIFLFLWIRPAGEKIGGLSAWGRMIRQATPALLRFLILPVVLALLTAAYNFARFHSILDFGYSHIPNVLNEPWYQHGIFSLHAIPWNMHKMLFEGFADDPEFPFIRFYPFGCSIFLASPLLCLIFREGGRFRGLAWTAIAVLTFALWCHGNPGGWQFSYRYAVVLVPWMFLLISDNGPKKLSLIETALFVISVGINALATYEFLWTTRIHP